MTGGVNGLGLAFSGGNNRISTASYYGYDYDTAGNFINEAGQLRTYDVENRIVSATGG